MAQLVQSFSGDTALRLQDEEVVRSLSFGTQWQWLRLALRVALPQATGSIGTGPSVYLGFCQGTIGYKSASTVEWVGARLGGVGPWNYSAGPPAGILENNGASPLFGYKVGATFTQTASHNPANALGITNRSLYLLDLIKTATGYAVMGLAPTAIPTVDLTEPNFLMAAHKETATDRSFNVNFASNYLLDSCAVYWSYASVGLEISSWLVIRFI